MQGPRGSIIRGEIPALPPVIPATGVRITRRGSIAAAAMSLAATAVLAGCATDQRPESFAEPARPAASELRALLEGSPTIAGARVNAGLLRRFYARHDDQPVWDTRQPQARALTEALQRAPGEHGLDAELFHASLLRDGSALSPLERDVLLSDAVLAYADALARGAVPVERRRKDETLTPEPVDVTEVLDRAMAGPDAAAAIEALAPTTPTYQALRAALQQVRTAPPAARTALLRAVEVNLERQRWLPRRMPADRVWVNVADEQLVMYRTDRPALSTRVVVGEDLESNQSPEFRATIDASFYNPPWVVPADIAAAEILPKLTQDPEYLTRNKMVLLANGEVEQLPGPDAGLGLVMFDMPNRFDVYLHDTPERSVFLRENRRISHGCIRVQHPRELAALLMEQSVDTVDQGISTGSTTRNALPTPVPVFVVYQTAFLGTDGVLQFRRDFYKRDDAIWRQMRRSA